MCFFTPVTTILSNSDLIEIIAIFVGIIIVIYQVDKGFKDNRTLQNQQFQKQIQIDLHKILGELISLSSSSLSELNAKLWFLPVNIKKYANDIKGNQNALLPDLSPHQLNELYYEAIRTTSRVADLLDGHQLTNSAYPVFKKIIYIKIDEVRKFYAKYSSAIFDFLPFDKTIATPTGELESIKIVKNHANEVQCENIEKLTNEFIHLVFDLLGYLSDIQIESQNIALGDLFDQSKLESRIPSDPSILVLKSDPKTLQELSDYITKVQEERKVKKNSHT